MSIDISKVEDKEILKEIGRRFEEKNASIDEMEFMTKKLLELNEKTKKAESIKGEFLSIIKNEFNNPLSNLLNLGSNIEKKIAPDAKSASIVKLLNVEIRKLDFHFKNIFAATEVEAGDIANYFSSINFKNLYDDAVESFKYLIDEKNLTLSLDIETDAKIVSDSYKIYLIFLNLLSNACEYSYPDSNIEVKVYEEDEEFIIEVKDYGEGIEVDYHNEVFNRFAKFTSGRTRAHTGLGLGLSVALGMAEALNGGIDFDTKEGLTIFRARIPKQSSDALGCADSSDDSSMTLFDDFGDDEDMVEM